MIDNEIILREEEEKRNQGKIDVPLSTMSAEQKPLIGKGLYNSQYQNEIIAAKRKIAP